MARPARASKSDKSRTATAQAPAPKTAHAVAEKSAAEKPAASAPEKPAVALVPDAPPEQPKRRGRPPASQAKKPARKAKGKNARPDILFLVETGEETGQYEEQGVSTVADLLDLMDENRKVVATRTWREF